MVIGIISVGFGSRFRVVDLEADLVVLFHQLPGDEPDSSNLSWHESRDGAGCHADDLVASKQRGGQTHPADSLPVVRHSNDHLSVPSGRTRMSGGPKLRQVSCGVRSVPLGRRRCLA